MLSSTGSTTPSDPLPRSVNEDLGVAVLSFSRTLLYVVRGGYAEMVSTIGVLNTPANGSTRDELNTAATCLHHKPEDPRCGGFVVRCVGFYVVVGRLTGRIRGPASISSFISTAKHYVVTRMDVHCVVAATLFLAPLDCRNIHETNEKMRGCACVFVLSQGDCVASSWISR